jgi:hypothetical protein
VTVYDYRRTEARVEAGALTRHDADLLHGFARWLGLPHGDRAADPSEGHLLELGAEARRIRASAVLPPLPEGPILEQGDNRHAAWRLVYAARGNDCGPPDDRHLHALAEQLERDGWTRRQEAPR